MKHIVLIIATFFVCTIFAQKTTQEEYNYIEAGISIQKRTGQDIHKRGYTIKPLYTVSWENGRTDEYIALMRDKDNSIAGIGCFIRDKNTGKSWNLCIPLGNNQLFAEYKSDMYDMGQKFVSLYSYAISLSSALYHSLDEMNRILNAKDQRIKRLEERIAELEAKK